ncbi:META domain-containing protein [Streptomyces sp. APSN-46.1]|uniref:META domain-containing protein n=1 Tax=Streptomyces sp. APSN-46.1 TaxID=2929049 RepID=UPI001FB41317|nr:META domain-containing protein [Streptomyces sp. APSN-46.1]MCJ1678837.1 META domain-containing protein [Streptomyces sp. APSN-46.1]
MRTFRRVPTVPVILVALVLAAAAAGCGDGSAALSAQSPHTATGTVTLTPPVPDAPLIATEWTVDSLLSGESAAPVPAGAAGRARFTISADGTASGNLGCNRFNAKATVEGPTLTLGPLTMTRMACLGDAGEVERALTELFGSGPLAWRIQGQALTLTAPDGKGLGAQAASAVE